MLASEGIIVVVVVVVAVLPLCFIAIVSLAGTVSVASEISAVLGERVVVLLLCSNRFLLVASLVLLEAVVVVDVLVGGVFSLDPWLIVVELTMIDNKFVRASFG